MSGIAAIYYCYGNYRKLSELFKDFINYISMPVMSNTPYIIRKMR